MQSKEDKGFYYFHADANALGGFLEEPVRISIPTLAPVSLPAVGGFTTGRSEAFTLQNIVRCTAAYTEVIGQHHRDGSVAILATAVVEGLNILNVVEAERIVGQLSITIRKGQPLKVSTAGSRFEGLRLEGCRREAILHPDLRANESDEAGHLAGTTAEAARILGAGQADTATADLGNRHDAGWLKDYFDWMKKVGRCSLVHGIADGNPKSCGHMVEIPGFGRFFFGELQVTADAAQLVSIRAELGCPVKGKISINCLGGGGISDN